MPRRGSLYSAYLEIRLSKLEDQAKQLLSEIEQLKKQLREELKLQTEAEHKLNLKTRRAELEQLKQELLRKLGG